MAAMSMVPHEEELDDDDLGQWPERHALASLWEENSDVRQRLRESQKMLRWPKVELVGVASLAALSDNRSVVRDCLTIWTAHNKDSCKPPPVGWLKEEVGD